MKAHAFALALLLAGCAASAQTEPKTAARVDVTRIAAHHPFANVVARYDADIATLRSVARTPAFADMHGQLNADADAIGREVGRARSRLAAIPERAPAATRSAPTSSPVDTNAAVQRFAQALAVRAARAHAYREQQAREKESTVALDFDRAHLRERLRLELRLRNNAYLLPRTRETLRSALAALDRRRAAAVAGQRAIDEHAIAADDARLQAAFGTQLSALRADLARHAQTMRETGSPAVTTLPRGFTQPRPRGAQTDAALASASGDLRGRFAELRGIDDGARTNAADEIRALVRERDELRSEIADSIRAQAERVARDRGLGPVYTDHAPAGAVDITSAVAASIEQGSSPPARK